MERWLKEHRPEIYRRLTASDLHPRLQATILSSLAGVGDYRQLPEWGTSPKAVDTDVLIITPQFSPDMIKDVIAMRSQRPGLHVTLLFGPQWWGQQRLTERVFDEIFEYGNGGAVEIITKLDTISACTTIVRGARTYLDVVAALFSPGRMIFRSEEFICADPNYDPTEEVALVERYLVEHASGIYHYWGDEASNAVRQLMNVKGPIENIPPAIVDELGPHERLPKLSASDGALHAVYAGDVMMIDGAPEHLENWRTMCEQGVHVHYYCPRPEWRTLAAARPYLKLEKRNPFFHIEGTVDFERALVEFTQYDWAYYHFEPIRILMKPGFMNVTPNLMYTFVQSELPMMIRANAGFVWAERMVEDFETGLAINTGDFSDIDSHLRAAMTGDLPERLRQRREAHTFKREALADLVLPAMEHTSS